MENNLQPPTQDPKPEQKHPLNLDLSKILAAAGALIIIIAIIIIVYSQWSNVGPLIRVSFIGIPMILLFIIGGVLRPKEEYSYISELTIAVGGLIFPSFIGTILFQFNIYPEIDELLFGYSALSGFIVFLIIEYLLNYAKINPLTILSFLVMMISFLIHLQVDTVLFFWVSVLISFVLIIFGALLVYLKKFSAQVYLNIGVWALAFFSPLAVIVTLENNHTLSDTSIALIVSFFGFFNLILCSIYHQLNKSLILESLYKTKRSLEEIIPLQIIIPLLYIAGSANEQNKFYSLAVIIISLIFMLLSYSIFILSLIWIGSIGLIIGLITLTNQLFKFNSTNWPLFLIIIGFLLIGVSIIIKKFLKNRKEHILTNFGQTIGIGSDPEFEKFDKTNVSTNKYSCLYLIIFLIFIAISSSIIESINYGKHNKEYYPDTYYDPTPLPSGTYESFPTYSPNPYNAPTTMPSPIQTYDEISSTITGTIKGINNQNNYSNSSIIVSFANQMNEFFIDTNTRFYTTTSSLDDLRVGSNITMTYYKDSYFIQTIIVNSY